MPQTWFVSDEHYNDKNMVGAAGRRPFSTHEKMIEAFRDAHNRVVGSQDLVCHLGDFCLLSGGLGVSTPSKILSGLNGQHVLIRGNHDRPHRWRPGPPFYWVRNRSSVNIEVEGEDLQIVMDHWPMRTWERKHQGALQLHGHEHGGLPPLVNQLDVCIENAHRAFGEWRPFSADDVVEAVVRQNLTPTPHPDNHYAHHGKPTPPLTRPRTHGLPRKP